MINTIVARATEKIGACRLKDKIIGGQRSRVCIAERQQRQAFATVRDLHIDKPRRAGRFGGDHQLVKPAHAPGGEIDVIRSDLEVSDDVLCTVSSLQHKGITP